jgi:hypothetical protein
MLGREERHRRSIIGINLLQLGANCALLGLIRGGRKLLEQLISFRAGEAMPILGCRLADRLLRRGGHHAAVEVEIVAPPELHPIDIVYSPS